MARSLREPLSHRRGLTYAKRLDAPEAWIERIAAGWHEPGDKRAVLLVQLAPTRLATCASANEPGARR